MFSKFRIARWSWLSGTISLLFGGFILATLPALFNYLAPSGRVTVTGCVAEMTRNVTGQIVAIPVEQNVRRSNRLRGRPSKAQSLRWIRRLAVSKPSVVAKVCSTLYKSRVYTLLGHSSFIDRPRSWEAL
ncbi:hypothetical protein [Bradyrhizobium sp. LB11.1]|uniref:hypothetical protein n=1 Tax=Bradyrhizobium sp. LB11.1 TaxID=3156326 RepID=UPI00339375AA